MFAKRLKELRLKKKLSQQNMADFLGITRQGYAKYERTDSTGSQPDLETLNKLANFFGVSIDYLVKGENNSAKTELTEKDEKDIAKDLEKILSSLDNPNEGYSHFDGQSIDDLDEEDRELLKAALETSMRIAKQIAKKKFTPKKYRKSDD